MGGGLSKLYQKGDTLIAVKTTNKGEFPIEKWYIVPLYSDDILDPSIGLKGPLNKEELKNQLKRKDTAIAMYKEIDIR